MHGAAGYIGESRRAAPHADARHTRARPESRRAPIARSIIVSVQMADIERLGQGCRHSWSNAAA